MSPNSPVYGYCPLGLSYLYKENRICYSFTPGLLERYSLGLELGTCTVSGWCLGFASMPSGGKRAHLTIHGDE